MGRTLSLSTVIYYTSNREDERFEKIIRDRIQKVSGDLPIISVSQKPIDFGYNICVGEVGVSNQNAHRQMQIGAQAATTQFVHFAEADCLYPKDYFQYIPPVDNVIYRTEVFLHYLNIGKVFLRKKSSECSTVVGREHVINHIETRLEGRGMWQPSLEHGKAVPYTFSSKYFKLFTIDNPIINIKTQYGMHWHHGTSGEVEELQYWGKPKDIDKIFL